MAKNDKTDEPIEPMVAPQTGHDAAARWLAGSALVMAICLGGLCYINMQSFYAQQRDLQQLKQSGEQQINMLHQELNTVAAGTKNSSAAPQQIIKQGLSEEEITQKIGALKQQVASEIGAVNKKYEQLLQQTSDNKHFKELLLASAALTIYDLVQNGADVSYETEVLKYLAQGDATAEKSVEKILLYTQGKTLNKTFLIGKFNEMYKNLNVLVEQNNVTRNEISEDQVWYVKLWNKFKEMFVRQKQDKTLQFDATNDEVYKLVNIGNFAMAVQKMHQDPKYINVKSPELSQWQQKASVYANFEQAVKELVFHALAVIHLHELRGKSTNQEPNGSQL